MYFSFPHCFCALEMFLDLHRCRAGVAIYCPTKINSQVWCFLQKVEWEIIQNQLLSSFFFMSDSPFWPLKNLSVYSCNFSLLFSLSLFLSDVVVQVRPTISHRHSYAFRGPQLKGINDTWRWLQSKWLGSLWRARFRLVHQIREI